MWAKMVGADPSNAGLFLFALLEKLKELDRKVYLLPDEEVERKRLQKLKLARKDKIARILNG